MRPDLRSLAFHWPPFQVKSEEDEDILETREEERQWIDQLVKNFYFIGAVNVGYQRRDPFESESTLRSPFSGEFEPLQVKEPFPQFVTSLLIVTWPLPEMVEMVANVKFRLCGRSIAAHRVKADVEDLKMSMTGRFDLRYPLLVSMNPDLEKQELEAAKNMDELSKKLYTMLEKINEDIPEGPEHVGPPSPPREHCGLKFVHLGIKHG
jgi:hypothetical protein